MVAVSLPVVVFPSHRPAAPAHGRHPHAVSNPLIPLVWPAGLWLAAEVVLWHTFNLTGLGPLTPACAPRGRLAVFRPRRMGLNRRFDLFGRGIAEKDPPPPPPKVRDEKSHVCCGTAPRAWSSIEREHRKPSATEGVPQAGAKPTLRNHRTGGASRDGRSDRSPISLIPTRKAVAGRNLTAGKRTASHKDAAPQM